MLQLKILNKNNYEYILEDLDGKHYNINLDFLDIKKEPNKRVKENQEELSLVEIKKEKWYQRIFSFITKKILKI